MKKVVSHLRNLRGTSTKSAKQLEETKQQLRQTRSQLKQTRSQLKEVRQKFRQLAREYLLCKVPARAVCAEIGVHEGDFSEQILSTIEPERLHLIDPWRHEEGPSFQESRYGNLGPEGQDVMDARYRQVLERFGTQVREGKVEIHRKLSDVAAADFERDYFDWVYIDGNHLYKHVKRDLELYYPKVKAGGYLAGDDYGVQGWWENGVQNAVDEFVSQKPNTTLEVRSSQFLIRKNS